MNCTLGFGIDANALDGSPQGIQFLKMARKISGADQTAIDIMKSLVTIMLPKFLHKLGPELVNVKAVSFFNDIIDQTLKMREAHGTKSSSMVDLFSETMMGEVEKEVEKEVEQELEGQTQGCTSIDIFVSPESCPEPGSSHVWSLEKCLNL